MKKRLIQAAGIFLAAMLMFTMLSRIADSVNVIQIQTDNPKNQMITHKVTGTGKVEGDQEVAVFVLENLQVEQVLAHAGEKVKKGEVLLKISENSISDAAQELEEKRLTLEDKLKELESQKNVNDRKRVAEQAWAGTAYGLAEQSGNISVDNAREELEVARQRLEDFYREKEAKNVENELDGFTDGESAGDFYSEEDQDMEESDQKEEQSQASEEAATENALQDTLRAKEEALNEAIAGRNQSLASAGKTVSDANVPESYDSTMESVKRELENNEEKQKKITELQTLAGKICSPSDGVIKSFSVQTGDITGQVAAVVLYASEGQLRLTGTISREDARYVSVKAEVQFTDDNDHDRKGIVENIEDSTEDEDTCNLSILLQDESLSIGQKQEFTVSEDSGPYSCCVPLAALHEENGKKYVYVTDSQNTVLGTVLVARKIEVTVLDKNQTTAALDTSGISTEQEVIVQSDRELRDGCRVRILEN